MSLGARPAIFSIKINGFDAMKERPAQETLESLRLTLLKVEQGAEPGQDAEAFAELKRILLQRIAELEAIQALEAAAAQSPGESKPESLLPPATVAEIPSEALSVVPAGPLKPDEPNDVALEAGPSAPPAEPD